MRDLSSNRRRLHPSRQGVAAFQRDISAGGTSPRGRSEKRHRKYRQQRPEQNLKRKLYSVCDNKTLADYRGPGQERPEHPAADRGHRGAAGGPARLPVAARRRSDRRWNLSLSRPTGAGGATTSKATEQALQTSRIGSVELRCGVGTRCRTRRRLHRRIRMPAERRASELGMLAHNLLCENTRWLNAT